MEKVRVTEANFEALEQERMRSAIQVGSPISRSRFLYDRVSIGVPLTEWRAGAEAGLARLDQLRDAKRAPVLNTSRMGDFLTDVRLHEMLKAKVEDKERLRQASAERRNVQISFQADVYMGEVLLHWSELLHLSGSELIRLIVCGLVPNDVQEGVSIKRQRAFYEAVIRYEAAGGFPPIPQRQSLYLCRHCRTPMPTTTAA